MAGFELGTCGDGAEGACAAEGPGAGDVCAAEAVGFGSAGFAAATLRSVAERSVAADRAAATLARAVDGFSFPADVGAGDGEAARDCVGPGAVTAGGRGESGAVDAVCVARLGALLEDTWVGRSSQPSTAALTSTTTATTIHNHGCRDPVAGVRWIVATVGT
jgi:hypothetical protein